MAEKTKLSVNLNKVALLRNQRDIGYPSVVEMARVVIAAGAEGITIHPRPDERHIRRTDAYELHDLLQSEFAETIEYNIEGYPTEDFVSLVLELQPTQVTLVPDAPDQATSDHGWDFDEHRALLTPIVGRLSAANLRVAVFVDPELRAVEGARNVGAHRIELYTEPYAMAHASGDFDGVLNDYATCAAAAFDLGLGVNAGHDLNLDNLPAFSAAVPHLAEVSIGHAITADALQMGFPAAVLAYLNSLA